MRLATVVLNMLFLTAGGLAKPLGEEQPSSQTLKNTVNRLLSENSNAYVIQCGFGLEFSGDEAAEYVPKSYVTYSCFIVKHVEVIFYAYYQPDKPMEYYRRSELSCDRSRDSYGTYLACVFRSEDSPDHSDNPNIIDEDDLSASDAPDIAELPEFTYSDAPDIAEIPDLTYSDESDTSL